jgi:hypothetical protein
MQKRCYNNKIDKFNYIKISVYVSVTRIGLEPEAHVTVTL